MSESLRVTIIVTAGILLTLPAATLGLPRLAHDADVHAARATHFSEQLWRGDPYPRWLAGMNAGLGSPSLFIYPPAGYYAAALFRPLLPGDAEGWRQTGLAAALAGVASGLAAYAWLRGAAAPRPALAAAILYMAAPYHLAVDLYARAALAELWAFVWMPLALLGVRGLVAARPVALTGTAVAFALLVMSHPPAVVLFSAVPLLYALYIAERPRRVRAAGATLAALVLGTGLSAVYWLPAHQAQGFTAFPGIATGAFRYANRFLFTGFPGWRGFDAKVSWATLDLAVVAFCAASAAWWSAAARRGERREHDPIDGGGRPGRVGSEVPFWAAIAGVAFLMTTPLSVPLWRAVPLLQKVLFPFRFNLLITLATAALLAACFTSFPQPCPRRVGAAVALMVLSIAAWGPAAAWAAWTMYPRSRTDQARLARIQERADLAIDVDEFRPRWAMPLRASNLAPFAGNPAAADFPPGSGRSAIHRWRPGDIALEIRTGRGGQVRVSQFYYPGWIARLAGREERLPVAPSVPEGLLVLTVPPGNHRVHLRLEPGQPERLGLTVTTATSLLLIVLLTRAVRRRRPFTPAVAA